MIVRTKETLRTFSSTLQVGRVDTEEESECKRVLETHASLRNTVADIVNPKQDSLRQQDGKVGKKEQKRSEFTSIQNKQLSVNVSDARRGVCNR